MIALRPPLPRRSSPFNLQFAVGWWINELPFLGLWWLLAGTVGTLLHPAGGYQWWLVAGTAALDLALLARIGVRAAAARPALSEAFRTVYGSAGEPRFTRPPWWRIVLLPPVSWRPDVRRLRNRRYGPARRGNRLDVYLSRRRGAPAGRPVLVYLHGSFRLGSKMLGARPLLYRLASQGWVCISAGRRLLRASYDDQLADVRATLAWVRANAGTYGADSTAVFLAGGSAGANLAATAALSGERVRGVIGLYGYYGGIGELRDGPTTRDDSVDAALPPFLLVHGALDTLVLRGDARRFADRLRTASGQPVVFAELPGAQHNFDYFHSLRFHAVVDAIAHFAVLTLASSTMEPSAPAGASPADGRVTR